jgi:hypothetical protein
MPFLAGYFPTMRPGMSEEAMATALGMKPGQSQTEYLEQLENLSRAYAALAEVCTLVGGRGQIRRTAVF